MTHLLDQEIIETFFYHDAPRLWTARDDSGDLFLINCAEEDEETVTYLATALPPHLYEALSTQSLHEVTLAGADIAAYVLRWVAPPLSKTTEPIARIDITDDWLPMPGGKPLRS